MEPIHGFQPSPLTQNFIENMSVSWPYRIIKRGISLDGDITTHYHYKAWIQLQQIKQDEFIKIQKIRDLFRVSMQEMRKNKRKRI